MNNICRLAIEVTFHTVQNLTDFSPSVSICSPPPPFSRLRPSVASRHVCRPNWRLLVTSGDFALTLVDEHVAIICSKLKFISGELYPKNYTDRKGGVRYLITIFKYLKLGISFFKNISKRFLQAYPFLEFRYFP